MNRKKRSTCSKRSLLRAKCNQEPTKTFISSVILDASPSRSSCSFLALQMPELTKPTLSQTRIIIWDLELILNIKSLLILSEPILPNFRGQERIYFLVETVTLVPSSTIIRRALFMQRIGKLTLVLSGQQKRSLLPYMLKQTDSQDQAPTPHPHLLIKSLQQKRLEDIKQKFVQPSNQASSARNQPEELIKNLRII